LAFCVIVWDPFTETACRTSANLPPSKTIRLNEILAVKLVVVNGCELAMTKLKVVPSFEINAGRALVPPMPHLADWPINYLLLLTKSHPTAKSTPNKACGRS
jgi:hypothetical protein